MRNLIRSRRTFVRASRNRPRSITPRTRATFRPRAIRVGMGSPKRNSTCSAVMVLRPRYRSRSVLACRVENRWSCRCRSLRELRPLEASSCAAPLQVVHGWNLSGKLQGREGGRKLPVAGLVRCVRSRLAGLAIFCAGDSRVFRAKPR